MGAPWDSHFCSSCHPPYEDFRWPAEQLEPKTQISLVASGWVKENASTHGLMRFFGDPYGTRTHVTAVKGRCLNHLTNGPGSGNLIRTDDIPGMNRLLYQLSYAAVMPRQQFSTETAPLSYKINCHLSIGFFKKIKKLFEWV